MSRRARSATAGENGGCDTMATKRETQPEILRSGQDVWCSVATDVATWVLAEPATMLRLAREDETWWSAEDDDGPLAASLRAGRVVGAHTRADGAFRLRLTLEPLTEREARVLSDEVTMTLVVEHGRLLLCDPSRFDASAPERSEGATIELAPGAYRLRLCALAWAEDAASTTRSGARSKRSLADYVLVFSSLEGDDVLEGGPALPTLERGPSLALRREQERRAREREAARDRLGALATSDRDEDLEALLAALEDEALRETAVAALGRSAHRLAVDRMLRLLEAQGAPPKDRGHCDALLRALAPHRSAAARSMAMKYMLTCPVGAGRVLLASGDPAVSRQVAEALVDPSIDGAVVDVAVAAAFELEPDEAFDRVTSALSSASLSPLTALAIERASLERIAYAAERVDPRWKRLLFRMFDGGRQDRALVALAMTRVDGVEGADAASFVRQVFAARTGGPAFDELCRLFETRGREPLASLARAARAR
jgi:hypothetical protein